MSEKTFYKMLLLSMAFHLVFVAVISTSVKRASRTINPFPTSYSVNLVDDIAGKSKGADVRSSAEPIAKKEPLSRSEKSKSVSKRTPPPLQPKEPQEPVRSLSPKKLPPKESTGTTKDELKRLEERIKEMKRRTANSKPEAEAGRGPGAKGGAGLPGSPETHGSGSGAQNSALIRYLMVMRDKIESAWHIPFISGAKKNLEAKVTVKIRRDGRILDISIDKRSGNRAYDESVLRVLRTIDPLPPIPQTVEEDPLEVEMTLRPEGVS
jgi:colicin import membrane protein